MPRDGSYHYLVPAGTDGVADQTIDSGRYNAFVHDVETDLNTPRPISAGGTGANNAADALTALGGESRNQLVTNYDIFPFVSGSFYSGPGATAAPNGTDFFEGICYATNGSIPDFYIEARSLATDIKYFRRRGGAGWGGWTRDDHLAIDLADTKVSKAGDTMSGSLTVNGHVAATLGYQFQDSGKSLVFNTGVSSFVLDGGPLQVNSGILATLNVLAGAGNYFFVDAGKYLKWDAGVTSFVLNGGPLQVNSGLVSTLNVQAGAGTYFFQDAGKYLKYDTGVPSFVLGGGPLQVNGGILATLNVQAGTGKYFFQDSAKYLEYNAGLPGFAFQGAALVQVNGNFTATGNVVAGGSVTAGSLATTGTVTAAGAVTSTTGFVDSKALAGAGNNAWFRGLDDLGNVRLAMYWDRAADAVVMGGLGPAPLVVQLSGIIKLGQGYAGRAGQAGSYDTNAHNFNWTGTANQMWIDGTNFGTVNVTCDYRTKKDVAPLASTWAVVKALNPIVYTHAAFTPPAAIAEAAARGEEAAPLFVDDDEPHWGFLAHELQETLLPSAAHGTKDSPTDIQTPNVLCLVTALTRALQEAMARIEALEGRAGATYATSR